MNHIFGLNINLWHTARKVFTDLLQNTFDAFVRDRIITTCDSTCKQNLKGKISNNFVRHCFIVRSVVPFIDNFGLECFGFFDFFCFVFVFITFTLSLSFSVSPRSHFISSNPLGLMKE